MPTGPYELWRGAVHLGRLAELSPSKTQGWEEGKLEPSPAFAEVAPLFAAEIQLLGQADRWPDAWEEAWAAAQGPGARLISPDGAESAVDLRIRGLRVDVQRR